jgi:hypothetical protein
LGPSGVAAVPEWAAQSKAQPIRPPRPEPEPPLSPEEEHSRRVRLQPAQRRGGGLAAVPHRYQLTHVTWPV